MTDFRALCAELVNELADFQWAVVEAGVGWVSRDQEDLIDRARAALSQPEPEGPPQPIPVSERLPGDELCWWYEPDEDDDPTGYGGNWTLLRIRGNVSFYTHWLPAHALPVPNHTSEND